MARHKVNVISLGCSKNLVDSERLLKLLSDAGMDVVHDGESDCGADIVVVNTCGFIGDAKEESINTILQCAQLKDDGVISRLYVMGCLSQRYPDELPPEIPQVDAWFGKTDWNGIVKDLSQTYPATASYDRVITTPRHHAYLKISEGCNRFCAFCAIPLITGRYHSRSIEDIVEEVKLLVSKGVKEFNFIAQVLTNNGSDLYGCQMIASLVEAIAAVDGVKWIRLHYAYPTDFPEDLLDVMAANKNVCRYLDIALQHISDKVLYNMRRHIDGVKTRELLSKIRTRVPGIHIRTTLMVGFPGEGDAEFDELKKFVREQKFERMGAFAYCEEEDTYAAKHFEDSISSEVKAQRLDELMAIQEEVSFAHQQSKVGKQLRVIVDREDDDYYVCRSEFDSPEVDPEVLVAKDQKLFVGQFYDVLVNEAMPFELIAKSI